MSIRQYIGIFAMGTGIAWVSFVVVLLNINPTETGWGGYLLFYLTLCISLIGSFTTLETLIRTLTQKEKALEHVIKTSIRHAFMFTLIFEGSLFLLANNLLNWWTILLIVLFVGLVEFFVLTAEEKKG